MNEKVKVFVSYTQNDKQWAEWIAWQVEEAGFEAIIQAWDFSTGNWVATMEKAMKEASRTIAVLSEHYLKAAFTQSEWQDAFKADPTGKDDRLIPVIVSKIELSDQRILSQLVYIDLSDMTEDEARSKLRGRLRGGRLKPEAKPRLDYPARSAQGGTEP